MDTPNKGGKYLRWGLVLAELLLTLRAGGPWLLMLFLLANALVWGIGSVPETMRFADRLKLTEPELYHRHQTAFDSGSILTINFALRREKLKENDEREMKSILRKICFVFKADGLLIAAFLFKYLKYFTVPALALSLVLLTGCASGAAPDETEAPASPTPEITAAPQTPTPTAEPTAEPASKVETLLGSMSLEEKVGQLFIIRPESLSTALTPQQAHDTTGYGVTEWTEDMAAQLEKYPAGGVAIFGKNISSPEQLKNFVAAMQQASSLPLFMGVDEEGGSVSRLANSPAFRTEEGYVLPQFKSMAEIGASGDTGAARTVGFTIGCYLQEYGFNLDFAPVADTNTNPDNVVIGDRAFGSDPELVSQMVAADLEGLHSAGVLGCIKHFPGHGDTVGDTHDGYVSIQKTWDELLSAELIPFINNLDNTDMVMVAHISLPNVTDDGLPASLSGELISGKLRGELGYDGVVITDSLAMGAIAQEYSSADCAVMALDAGVDILLMPEDYAAAFEGVVQAVEDGRLSMERIDESVRRVLELKDQLGLL